jgi:hypothetical protein
MDTEQKPDFELMSESYADANERRGCSSWLGLRKGNKAGMEEIWTDYVTPLRSALQEIVSCQDDPEKSLANLNGAIRNAKSLLQKHQPNKVK